MGLGRRLSTLRHGRGFGVHSPLAYELISAVLKARPGYYADAEIDRLFAKKRLRRIGKIILRLIARFEPRKLYCPADFIPLIKLCDSRLEFTQSTDSADMKIECSRENFFITIGRETAKSGPLVLDNEKDLRITIHRSGLSPTLINTTL